MNGRDHEASDTPDSRRCDRAMRLAQIAAWVVAIAAALPYAFLTMFTRLSVYDDEGYLMLSVEKFLDGLPLYDRVYSQYGPFYYLLRKASFGTLGVSVTHDVTRLLTMGQWLAAAGLCAWCVYRLTKSSTWSVAAFLAATAHGSSLAAEPGHPQELVVLLLAACAAAAATWSGTTGGLCLLGVLAAFALLTKINVGVFALLGLATAWLSLTGPSRAARLLLAAASAAAVVLPFALMRPFLGSWAAPYATVVSLATASCCLWASLPGDWKRLQLRQLVAGATAAAAAVAAVCAATVWLGTSARGVVLGVVLRPLREVMLYITPLIVGEAAVAAAAFSAALAAALFALTRSGRLPPSALETLAGAGKAGLGVVGLWVLGDDPGRAVAYVVPFLWIALVPHPLLAARFERRYATVVLVLLAVLQTLTAYPVAGTQRHWATFLLLPVLVTCLADAWTLSMGRLRRSWVPVAEGALLALVVALYLSVLAVWKPLQAYRTGTPSGLPGFQLGRLPEETVRTQQWLASTIAAHCDALVTMPGYGSLYFWANMDPPTGYNAGNWMSLLTDREQQATVDALAGHPRGCVIRNVQGIEFWVRARPYVKRPLVEYIRKEFRTVQRNGPYELMVRNARAWEGARAETSAR